MIFGRSVTEKGVSQKCFVFPPLITSASALPDKTGDPEIASFSFIAACCFTNEQQNLHIIA